LGRSSLWFTKAWILASVIVDRTYAACGSGMEASSAAISSLGFVLDLTLQRVLTCMRKRSAMRNGDASTWLAEARGWMGTRPGARRSQDRKKATAAGKRWEWKQMRREEEERGMGSTPPRAALFIGGSTDSARCGSFRRTTRLNGSILISSRDNLGGFAAYWLKLQPKIRA
jgi:hypothetical protein